MIIGTANFVSKTHANRYYRAYGYDAADVQRKIDDGEIHIGAPVLKDGETLGVVDNGTRYAINTGNNCHER